jgi:hypothetical protein
MSCPSRHGLAVQPIPHHIGGKRVAGNGVHCAQLFNPATGEQSGTVPLADCFTERVSRLASSTSYTTTKSQATSPMVSRKAPNSWGMTASLHAATDTD